jgi:hypothetical protein
MLRVGCYRNSELLYYYILEPGRRPVLNVPDDSKLDKPVWDLWKEITEFRAEENE